MKQIKNDDRKGYTCVCGKYHKFSSYVYAHTHVSLIYACGCGLEVEIWDCVAYTLEEAERLAD